MINKSYNRKLWFLPAVTIVTVILTIVLISVISLTKSLLTPVNHLDGAFQTASFLFRMDAGQLPGRDFFPYLGVSNSLLIYAVFKMTAGTLAGSVFASYFTTLLLYFVSLTALWKLFFPETSRFHALIAGSFLFIAVWAGSLITGSDMLSFLLEPGNSLRPIRSAIPYLFAAVYINFIAKDPAATRSMFIMAGMTALTLLWSNDYAIPTAALFLAFFLADNTVLAKGLNWRVIVIALPLSAVFYAAALLAVTGGAALSLLEFNYVDVAGDQWWYFGNYSWRIFEFRNLMMLLPLMGMSSLFVLGCSMATALTLRSRELGLVVLVGLCLVSGGVLACVGGHLEGGYFKPFRTWSFLVVSLAVIRLLYALGQITVFRHAHHARILWNCLAIGCVILALSASAVGVRNYQKIKRDVVANERLTFVPELGGFIDRSWTDYIAFVRDHRDAKIIEEYLGIWTAVTRPESSLLKVDSVIHALGSARESSQAKIGGADYAITTRYDSSPVWQPWSISQNYWFYREVFQDFSPVAYSPAVVVWERRRSGRKFPDIGCSVAADGRNISIRSIVEGIYEVTLRYSAPGSGRRIVMLQNNLSFGAGAGGFVSLNPKNTAAILPVLLKPSDGGQFMLKTFGRSGAEARIEACSARKIELLDIPEKFHSMLFGFVPRNTPAINSSLNSPPSTSPFNLTDSNWTNGVATARSGMFVSNSEANRSAFRAGVKIKFANGEVRQISRVIINDIYLNMYFDGEPLDGHLVGYPRTFSILHQAE